MKKYLLFAGDHYYPSGGWDDFRGSFDTIEELKKAELRKCDWYHIIDRDTQQMLDYGKDISHSVLSDY